ncbi:MAG: cytidine deaminase [Erysipelotrichales bacterium]|nr:cytidine deaminase [Erysipelotrichales bacterium]
MTREELLHEAFEAMKNSYSPYSHYPVGACLLTKDGKKYYGANIENASFGLTNCAERSAVFNAYSNGVKKEDIEALAIVSEGPKVAAPCGACRQVLNELLPSNCPIYLSNRKETVTKTIEELLPMSFGPEDVL